MTNAILLLGISLAWASDYLFIGLVDHDLPPITVAAITSLLAGLVLLVVIGGIMRRPMLPTLLRRPEVPLVMAVTAVAAPKLSVVVAEGRISSDLASLVGTTVPVLTLLVAMFVTRETRYSNSRILGVGIAFLGMIVFVGITDTADIERELIGVLIMMAGGVAFTFNGLYSGWRAKDFSAEVLTVWVLLLGGAGLALAAAVFEADRVSMPDAKTLAALAGSGLLSMGLAYIGYYALIARAGATFTALYAYLVPPLGLLCGVLFLGHSLTVWHVAGVALTLVGLWLLTKRDRTEVAGPDRAGN